VRREHLRDNNGALQDWTRVLAIDSLNSAAYFARAEILREQEKFQEAHNDYAACLRTGNPDNVTTLTARGFCAMKLKRTSEAMTDFTAAIAMTDSASGRSLAGFDAWFYRGSLHLQRRKFKEAVFDFDAALRLNDQSGETYYLRGYAKMLGGNTQDGCIDVAQANELHYAAAKGLIEQHCDVVPNLDSLRRYTMPTVTVTAGRSPAEIAMTDSRRLLGRVQSLVANPTATQQYGISQTNVPAFRSPPGTMSPFDCNKQRLEMTRPSQINLGCVAQILQEELRKVRDPQMQAMVNNIMDTANDLYILETPMQDDSSPGNTRSVNDINTQQIQLVRIRLADQFRELNTYLARRQESLKASSK
jgi:tetratricopeptide (TPR) repeat protein